MSFKEYIQGKRHGKDANELERDAMNDPFLNDAIEGFDLVSGEHLPVIEALETKIRNKTAKPSQNKRIWLMAVAASISLLIGISFFMNYQSESNPTLSSNTIKSLIDTLNNVTSIKDTLVVEKQLAENKDIEVKKSEKVVAKIQSKQLSEVKKLETVTDLSVTDAKIDAVQELAMPETLSVADNLKTAPAEKPAATTLRIRGASSLKATNQKMVFGRVLDENDQPLIGASVKFENQYNATISDFDGKFIIPAPKNQTEKLIVSYIGYEKVEMPVAGDSAILRLKPNDLALNEAVVVGYGTAKKIDLNKFKTAEAENALQGRMAGVDVSARKHSKVFGEKEFEKYFAKNISDSICKAEKGNILVAFRIDETGKPIDIKIINCNCAELEAEFLRLINTAPLWTKTQRDVILNLKL